jgi:hypothetical protein
VAAVIHDAPDFAYDFHLQLVRFPARIPRISPFIRLIFNVFLSSAFWIEETFNILNPQKSKSSRQQQNEEETEEEDADRAVPSESDPGPGGDSDPNGGGSSSGDKKRRRTGHEDRDNHDGGGTRATRGGKRG